MDKTEEIWDGPSKNIWSRAVAKRIPQVFLGNREECFTIKGCEIRCPGLAKITFPGISTNEFFYKGTKTVRKQFINLLMRR